MQQHHAGQPQWASGLRWGVVGLAMVMMAVGCGDSELTRTATPTDTTGGMTSEPMPDMPGDTSNGTTPSDTSPTTTPEEMGCCVMVPAGGDTSLLVEKFSVLNIGVLLYSRSSGEPVADEVVEYTLEGEGDAQLSVRSVVTDNTGRAQIQFQAGEALNQYTVTAS
ncbi:MAG: hypothetical protein AAFS10_14795, partial [Myxococcota bacterium]